MDNLEKFEPDTETKDKPREIKDATDLDDLCQILSEKGEVVGSETKNHPEGKVYPAQGLIDAIHNLKTDMIDRAIKSSDLPAHKLVNILFKDMQKDKKT